MCSDIVVLICLSFMTNDVEHLFIGFVIFSKTYVHFPPYFVISLFLFVCLFSCCVLELICIFFTQIFVRFMVCKYFLPICRLLSSLSSQVWSTKVLNFDDINFKIFPFVDNAFDVKSRNSSPSPRYQSFSPMFL